jgi:hypothetical protein
MLIPQVAIGAHCQGAAVFMPKPSGGGGNIDAAFNATGSEQIPEVVVGEPVNANHLSAGAAI